MLKWGTGRHRLASGVVVFVGLLLAGCEGRVTVDLATAEPADPEVAQVAVNLLGLEFLKNDSSTETVEFNDSEAVDLLDYANGDPLRVFTDERLPEGTYTGVRLLVDEVDAFVIRTDGGEFPVVVADGDYAGIDFTVEDQENSNESLTLTLDLRQSLSFNDDTDDYTLTPVLRSVRTGDAGQITGTVDVACPAGSSLAQGGAVYLFEGEGATPDDRDTDTEPYATARIVTDPFSGLLSYTLRFLLEGDYTFALTCKGDQDDPVTDDDLDFQNIANVQLGQSESLTRNVTD